MGSFGSQLFIGKQNKVRQHEPEEDKRVATRPASIGLKLLIADSENVGVLYSIIL